MGSKDRSLATVSSLILSNTSIASCSALKDRVIISNVRLRMVSGHNPCNVCGSRVTSDTIGYGIFLESQWWERDARVIWTCPHLLLFGVLINEYEVVCREVEGARLGCTSFAAEDMLDL